MIQLFRLKSLIYPVTTTYEDVWSNQPAFTLSDSYSSGGGAGTIGGGGWGDPSDIPTTIPASTWGNDTLTGTGFPA